jgi:hypothetical protein
MLVVALNGFDSATELSSNISKKIDKVVKVSDLSLSGKFHK